MHHLPILINISLRGATLGAKFALIFVLARYLTPEELGMYGLFLVTVAYSIYPLGFEFYSFSSRQMVKAKKNERKKIIKNQLFLHLILYATIFPFFYLIFYLNLLPKKYILYFFILVVLEHLNQEAIRLLVAMQHQLVASCALFMRQGLWAVIIAAIFFFFSDYRSLENVFLAWIAGGICALLLSALKTWQLVNIVEQTKSAINIKWIKGGLLVALPLFLASLSSNLISTVDRYWYENLNGLALLGAYVFYASIANAIVTFMDAGIFSFLYPKLLDDHAKKNYNNFEKNLRSMSKQVYIVSIIFILISLFFAKYVFELMNKSVYIDNIYIFYVLVLAMTLQGISNIPQFSLYSIDKDKPIVIASLISIPIFLVTSLTLSLYTKQLAIPIALCLVHATALFYKKAKFKTSYNQIKATQ